MEINKSTGRCSWHIMRSHNPSVELLRLVVTCSLRGISIAESQLHRPRFLQAKSPTSKKNWRYRILGYLQRSSKWHQRNKDFFFNVPMINDSVLKKQRETAVFFVKFHWDFASENMTLLCDPRCGCDRPDESRSRSPRRCQWPRFHGFHLSGSPQEIEVHSMNSS